MGWVLFFATVIVFEIWGWLSLTGMTAKNRWTGVVVILFTAFAALAWALVNAKSSDKVLWAGLIIVGGGLAAWLFNSMGRWIIDAVTAILPDKRDPMVRAFEEKKSDAEYKQRLARELEENKQYWATEGLKFLRQPIDELNAQISPAFPHHLSIAFEEGNQIAQIVLANETSTHRIEVRKVDMGFEIQDGKNVTKLLSADQVKEAIGKFAATKLV